MRRWERELQATSLHGPEVFAAVDRVEPRSWKAREGTVLDAGERAFYISLLSQSPDCRLVLCTTCQAEPVACFIEMRVGDTVYDMESSYALENARLSPGTFPTTIDLYRRWKGSGVRLYDLLGGRGPLKDAIASAGIACTDVAWPEHPEIRRLRAERQRYDRHWAEVSRSGLGAPPRHRDIPREVEPWVEPHTNTPTALTTG